MLPRADKKPVVEADETQTGNVKLFNLTAFGVEFINDYLSQLILLLDRHQDRTSFAAVKRPNTGRSSTLYGIKLIRLLSHPRQS
jgi:hypothetical protein